MPELPEVEVLVRHLAPLLKRKTIREVEVRRPRVIRPTSEAELRRTLRGATFCNLTRRGKYLVFTLRRQKQSKFITVVGHLGMTGRMYLARPSAPAVKHAAVILELGRYRMIFEDTRYFGRFTLDTSGLAALGPEPLSRDFTPTYLASALERSSQAIKVKLLDQSLVAGVGNIYASEALFRAGIAPQTKANRLTPRQLGRLCRAVRQVLAEAIRRGSTVPLDFAGDGARDGLFYYGSTGDGNGFYSERLRVYDRHGRPCPRCATPIKRFVQAARSTFYCPKCQRAEKP